MTWYFYILIGLALGLELGRRTAGKPSDWKKVLITVLIAALVAAGIALWARGDDRGNIACTMEAKLCPDGSYVGRTGPNCEFTPCPR